jgi:stage IV sporulation protein FB
VRGKALGGIRLGGVELAVHPGLLLLLAAALAAGMGGEVAVFAAVLAGHELAHLLAAAAFDLRVRALELLPFGGVAQLEGLELADPGVEAVVALAGPLHNLLCLAAALLLREQGWLRPDRGTFFLVANAALALGNLLPALPLDGGRVVRAALATRWGAAPATAWVAKAGVWAGGALLAAGGILLLWRGVLAPGLFVFGYFACARARTAREVGGMRPWRELSSRWTAIRREGVLAVQPLAVDPSRPLREVVTRLVPRRYHLVWLVDASGRARGPWDEADLWATLRRHGAEARGGDLERPCGGRSGGPDGRRL